MRDWTDSSTSPRGAEGACRLAATIALAAAVLACLPIGASGFDVPRSDAALFEKSSLIVAVRVTEAKSVSESPFTDYHLELLRLFKGSAPEPFVLRVSGTAALTTGEQAILFLAGQDDATWRTLETWSTDSSSLVRLGTIRGESGIPAPVKREVVSEPSTAPLLETPPQPDSANTAVPAPNHPLYLGYSFADGRYGDFLGEVACYTNLYYAWARRGYETDSDEADDVWIPRMGQGLTTAAAEGMRVMLNLNLQETGSGQTPIGRILDLVAPHWDRVLAIELADEPAWDRALTEAYVRDVRRQIQDRGLPDKPLGFVVEKAAALVTDAVFAQGLDFVTIEAYVDPPGDALSVGNEYLLNVYLNAVRRRIPSTKKLSLVMMAYAAGGAWTNIGTLSDLQIPTYAIAAADPRIFAVSMFAYGRATGTRDHPELGARHRQIAQAMGIDRCKSATTLSLVAAPNSGRAPLEVNLTATFTNVASCGSSFSWDFGDGSGMEVAESCWGAATVAPSRTLHVTHKYPPGQYRATLWVGPTLYASVIVAVTP